MYQSPSPFSDEQFSSEVSRESFEPNSSANSAFDYSAFDPAAYIAEYYSEVGAENRFLLEFYHRAFQHIPRGASFLEFGGGPTIYQLLSARRRVKEIVFAEYLPANRREIEKWVFDEPGAFNWSEYIDLVLALEHKQRTEEQRRRVRQELSKKVTQIIACDAYSSNILGNDSLRQFDVVSSSFCLECISPYESDLRSFFAKLDCVLRPRGMLVLTMLKKAESYKIGDLMFPACSIDEDYMRGMLRDLGYHWVSIESVQAEADQGYAGLIAITAEKG
ncbi:MAG: guanitoxin biosynthesis pre-guanitoxin forming N-methyltransferase GntF [Bdellovibrionota bacterium]